MTLALLTGAAYLPLLPGGFIWDDDSYVTDNEVLRDPAGWRRVWIPRETPQYYPLTFSVLWLQYQLWGLDPLGYHLVNLALHIANALLVWGLLARIRAPAAWAVGAAFALHPLHVETAAWVTELKNCLSGFFYLGAAHAYLGFDRQRRHSPKETLTWVRYAATTLLFTCALLSKSVTCTLPVALIGLLLLQRQKLTLRRIWPLLALLPVGLAFAANTAAIEADFVGASGPEFEFTPVERLLIASRALLFYPAKLLVPWPLLFNYTRWSTDPGSVTAWWGVALAVACTVLLALLWRRGSRAPAIACGLYAVTISPALGFVSFFPMRFSFVADHFCYLASASILALAAAGLYRAVRSSSARRWAFGVWLCALALLTARRAHVFSDAGSLYRHTLAHNEESWLAHSSLGMLALDDAGRSMEDGSPADAVAALEKARGHFAAAVTIHERHYDDHYNLAVVLEILGDPEAAVPHARRAAEIAPTLVKCQELAGRLLARLGRPAEALPHFAAALELDPNPTRVRILGDVYREVGREGRAAELYRSAFRQAEHQLERLAAGASLAKLLATAQSPEVNDPVAALSLTKELSALTPKVVPELLQARASALATLGRWEEAIDVAEILIEIADATKVQALIDEAHARLADLQQRSRESAR